VLNYRYYQPLAQINIDMVLMKIRSRLLKMRGFLLKDIALALNINRSYLSQVLVGRRSCSFALAQRLSQYTGINCLFYLLDTITGLSFYDVGAIYQLRAID
jgi:hypothetical protein